MSSQAFDAQLLVPDNNASQLEMVNLITTGKITGPGLPDVAHRYLDAFCNKSYSNGRRRWAGIALAGMMRASASVVQRLKKLSQGSSRIGAIILDPDESEERRVIAGLIIRQGLEAGIDFADFWESDKVMHSAPNFPRDSNDQWMGRFQAYLDTLGGLVLTNQNADPLILYPISLSTNDRFQWTGKSAVAIIEKDFLTITMSDSTLTKFHFIDIPVSHIKNTRLQQDSPQESQEGRSGHKMHNLIMTLQAASTTYRLNSSDHRASEFKVSFLKREDADELDIGLQDARKSLAIARAATAKVADGAAFTSSPNSLLRPAEQRPEATHPHKHAEDVPLGSDTDVRGTLDELLLSEKLRGERKETRQPTEDKGKGKLPRISKATKQKVVRTKQLSCSSSKITKPRASKSMTPVVYQNGCEDEDEDEESSQDEYDLKSKVSRSQGRRKADAKDDDDYAPPASKGKAKSTKRKRASSDVTEESRPKKTQIRPSGGTQAVAVNTVTKKQKAKSLASASVRREPMKQSTTQQNLQNEHSSRPSLIGGLLKSESPSQASAATFKKPGQPASTPGRPRVQPVRPSPRPQTPAETCGDVDNHSPYILSSTPRSQAIHDEDFGIGHTPANTEILSSNTKRVPDSPHAESTAISGHADRDDVNREKRIGDMETARNDPFQQRRQSQKITSLYRRFTEESAVDDRCDPLQGEPFSTPAKSANNDAGAFEMPANSMSQPLPRESPSLFKNRTNFHNRFRIQNSPARVREFKSLLATSKETRKAATEPMHKATRPLKFDTAGSTHMSQDDSTYAPKGPSHKIDTTLITALNKQHYVAENMPNPQTPANDSVVSASRDATEDTLFEASGGLVDELALNGDTTLVDVDEEVELPEQYRTKASDLRFRSSPPLADSSSVQGASSDVSEAEPEPSPPTSRADELEWEAALQPHQRTLHEQMLRTSKRVMRHIVDNEIAVTDITDAFAGDGERLLDLLLERQSDESAEAFQELAKKRQGLLKELSDTSKSLKALRKQVRALD